jgi:hypothetical protein
MAVRNQNWYNLQATRRYPLDDKSTGVDNSGGFIRDDIIVDCHIRFPESLGNWAYVQGITVTPNLITVIFGAAADETSQTGTTIAAVSLAKPATPYVNQTVTAIYPGVSGWVAFGPGIDNDFIGRYTTPAQTLIAQRNARPYQALPIPSIGKENVNKALQNLVRITANSPVTVTYVDENDLPQEQRWPKYNPYTDTTNYAPIRALVFSTETPTAGFNPLTNFLGPCGQRPESETCTKTPIERINGVAPDCQTGNINITVAGGGLSVRPFIECGGIDITTPRGLAEACQRDPKSEKTRKDECCEGDDALADYCWPPFDPGADNTCESTGAPCPTLPICTSFSPCHESLFDIASGSFGVQSDSAPPVCCPEGSGFSVHDVYAATSTGVANIALYRGCASDWAYNHAISVEVKPVAGGPRQNGGLVANYMRVTEGGRCKTKYVAAIVDIAANELQLYRFDGTSLIKENKLTVALVVGHWYKITLTADATGNDTSVHVTVEDKTTGAQVGSLTTNITDYEAVDGRAGLFTLNSVARFNRFEVV